MASDEGSQIVTIRFHRPVDSDIVNKRFKDIRMLGIYKGGYLTKAGNVVTLSPLVCEISDGTYQVRVETTANITKTLSVAAPYLVLNWIYSGVVDTDFMVIEPSGDPDANDIVVAKGHFVGAALNSIDYSERTTPDTHHLFLRVEEMEIPSSSVRVRAGVGHKGSVYSSIMDQPVTITANSGETVYVFVDDSGGVTSSKVASEYVGKALLAKIVYPADGIIENSDIEDVRSFITPPAIPDGVTIERDSSGKLQIKDRTQYLSTVQDVAAIEAVGAWQTAPLGTIKNQSGISVVANRITLTAGRKYLLSYLTSGAPIAASVGDPNIQAKWVVISGDSSWDIEDTGHSFCECAHDAGGRVMTQISATCYIIPSVTTVIELQIYTENTAQKSRVDKIRVNIITVD